MKLLSKMLSLPATLALTTSMSVFAQRGAFKTDLGAYMPGPTPALPAPGGKVIDPTFGTEIMRITGSIDANSVMGTAYAYWPTFNENNTKLLAFGITSEIYDFDPINFTLGQSRLIPRPPGGHTSFEDTIWSAMFPNKLFMRSDAKFIALNTDTMTYEVVGDLTSRLPAGSYFAQMSMSRDDDVFAATVKNPDYTDQGWIVWKRSTNTILSYVQTKEINECQVDKSGKFLYVITGNQGYLRDANGNVIYRADGKPETVIESKIVDLSNGSIQELRDGEPDYTPSHHDIGTGTVVGSDNWTNRITFRNLATPRTIRTVFSYGNDWTSASHISMLANDEGWTMVSHYGAVLPNAFNNELTLMATDGTQRVRRFAHHYSAYQDYWSSPRANISRDGKYVAFTSNWGDPSGRRDLFVVRMPAVDGTVTPPMPPTEPPPGPVPPPPSTSDIFVSSTGFSVVGGNRLEKLATPYYASSETKSIAADGSFSFKYNEQGAAYGVSVALDDGVNSTAVTNQGQWMEVRVDGVYALDWATNLASTIKIERAGGVIKVFENSTLRYASTAPSTGAAKFKVALGGDAASIGMGINSAVFSAAATTTPPPAPTPTPPPAPTPAPEPVLTSISASHSSISLGLRKTTSVSCKGLDAQGNQMSSPITYSVLRGAIASIDQSGNLTGRKIGTTSVRCQSGSIIKDIPLTVTR